MLKDILTELEALVEIYTNLVVEKDGLPNKLVIYFDAELKLDEFNKVFIRKDENSSFQIHHFPPITTRFTFTSEKSVASGVIVDVSCYWLPRNLQQNLIDKIQSILSNSSIDDGILWNCLQFIENECLSVLFGSHGAAGAASGDFTIDIDKLRNDEKEEKERENDDLYEIMKDYDRRKCKRVFDESFIECGVCFMWKRGSDCMELEKCGHVMCLRCVTEFFNESMKSGNLELQCSVCNETMEYGELKLVLNNEEFERWDKLLLNQCLKQATEISECPRCTVSVFTEEQHGFCAQCDFVFCVECRMTYHGPGRCERMAKRLMDDFNKKQEDKLRKDVCICPCCKEGYEKIGGCNKMTCGTCGTFFCHLCRTILDKCSPYSHFGLLPKCIL